MIGETTSKTPGVRYPTSVSGLLLERGVDGLTLLKAKYSVIEPSNTVKHLAPNTSLPMYRRYVSEDNNMAALEHW